MEPHITLKRCLISGFVLFAFSYFVLNEIASKARFFVAVLIAGVSWLIWGARDNRSDWERVTFGEIIVALLQGALLSGLGAIPFLLACAILKTASANH